MLDTVVPVGRALGTLDEGASFTIRVGARLVATTRADYSYWLAVCAGAAGDTAGFTPVIPASLRRAGLVLRLTETDAPAVLSRHHLLAQGHGLGYDSRTDTFVIGDSRGEPRARVSEAAYRLWSRPSTATLWEHCRPLVPAHSASATDALISTITDLRALLTARVAVLDRR